MRKRTAETMWVLLVLYMLFTIIRCSYNPLHSRGGAETLINGDSVEPRELKPFFILYG
jgi:hypothetical protein